MTSISVISPSVDKDSVPTLSTMIDPELSINNLVDHAAAHQKLASHFKVKTKHEIVWTNFHCILCLGITGFTIFWTILLLRLYLPVDNIVMVWWFNTWKHHGK